MTNEPNPGDVVTWVERFELDGQIVDAVKWLRTTATGFAVIEWYKYEMPGRHWWIDRAATGKMSQRTTEEGALDAIVSGPESLLGQHD